MWKAMTLNSKHYVLYTTVTDKNTGHPDIICERIHSDKNEYTRKIFCFSLILELRLQIMQNTMYEVIDCC